jgi:hypothetical protein
MFHAKLLLTAWEHLNFQFSDAALAGDFCSAEKTLSEAVSKLQFWNSNHSLRQR